MRQWLVSCGISSQILTSASLSFWTEWDATWQHQMELNMMAQRCSIGFRSGEHGDQSMVSIRSYYRICLHTVTPLSFSSRDPEHLHPQGSDNRSNQMQFRVPLSILWRSICPSIKPVMLNNIACGIMFTVTSPNSFMSVTWARRELALICEKHRAPVPNLPILVFSGKCQDPGNEHRSQ